MKIVYKHTPSSHRSVITRDPPFSPYYHLPRYANHMTNRSKQEYSRLTEKIAGVSQGSDDMQTKALKRVAPTDRKALCQSHGRLLTSR